MSSSPPSLTSEFSEAQNPTTQARVQMATAKAAQDIAASDPASANYAARTALATQVARSPQMYTVPFTNMLCAQGITSASTDAEISTMIAAVWDTMAGKTFIPTVPA